MVCLHPDVKNALKFYSLQQTVVIITATIIVKYLDNPLVMTWSMTVIQMVTIIAIKTWKSSRCQQQLRVQRGTGHGWKNITPLNICRCILYSMLYLCIRYIHVYICRHSLTQPYFCKERVNCSLHHRCQFVVTWLQTSNWSSGFAQVLKIICFWKLSLLLVSHKQLFFWCLSLCVLAR